MAGSYTLSGASSAVVNGQLVPFTRPSNLFPRPISATGPGGSGVPAFPPQTSAPGMMGGSIGATASAGAATAGANPWSPVSSPVPWLIAFLIAAVLLMRYVHHGY